MSTPVLMFLCKHSGIATVRTKTGFERLSGCALPLDEPSRLIGGRTRQRWVQMLAARLAPQAQLAGHAIHPPHRMPRLKPLPAQMQVATKLSYTSFKLFFPCREL